MYTLKVSRGYVDEPETDTAKILGTYETLDEALAAADNKIYEVMYDIGMELEVRVGEIQDSPYRYYVTYGSVDEYGTVVYGYNEYYEVRVIER